MLATLRVFFIGAFCAVADAQTYNSKIILYHRSTYASYPLTQAEKELENSKFMKTHPTVLYFHGYNQTLEGHSVQTIVNAYAKAENFNILVMDWRELAAAFYVFAATNIDKLGIEVAKFIQKMTTQGYAIKNWHLVGHSLGAHIAGFVGRHVQNLSKKLLILPRITALDPANPGFYFY